MSTETTAPLRLPPARPAERAPCDVTEHRLSFDGFGYLCRVVWQDAAVTEPLVLLGGSSQDRFSWARHEERLAEACTVVTLDLPGYGAAEPLPTRYGIDFLAAAVRHTLYELGMAKVNLMGACFGGAIALRFAQHYPDALRRLMLAGMTTRVPREYAEAVPRWLRMLDEDRREEMAGQLVARFMSPSGAGRIRRHAAIARLLHQQFMAQTPRQIGMAVVDHNVRLLNHEWYRPEPVPPLSALVFTGEYDSLTTPRMGRETAAQLPGAAFLTVRDADHLVHMERIEEFTDLLLRFCTDRPIDDLPYCHPVEYPGAGPERTGS
ncbi:alpha/beta fold hydrolase [Streptomyces sp. RPT161]|uniref:alpha/beta fold hydrolase n=1 Tax=Streptomyces sp. RPT161 TaxID=3015993 RepID=UPI0022B87E62|nr:alpha/beta hydrolase [Streptomyces sp. RPT161]